jgi:hypothetical protein
MPQTRTIRNTISICSSFDLKEGRSHLIRSMIMFGEIFAIAAIRRPYIPVMKATVPPDTPGIMSQIPIRIPFTSTGRYSVRNVLICMRV